MAILNEHSVIDNLDSKEKKRPLSARMGSVLRQLIRDSAPKDSGWYDLTDALKSVGSYENYYSNQHCRIRRIGDIVYMYAEVRKIKSEQPATYGEKIYPAFNIPEEFRPDHDIRAICQGSNMNRCVCRIMENGTVAFDRFGVSSAGAISVNYWIAVNMIWMV